MLLTAALLLSQAAPMKAVPVKVVGKPGSYQLMRGGKPFFVKGAGGGNLVDLLPKYGANAARTWGLEWAEGDLEK